MARADREEVAQEMSTTLGHCVLEGTHVRLEPMRIEHARDLTAAAQDSDWTWLSVDCRTEAATVGWIQDALKAQDRGTEYPFVVYHKTLGRVVGSTRYMDVRPSQRGVEVGWTWYSSQVWSTAVNPECKF